MFRNALIPIDGSALALEAIDLLRHVHDLDGDVLLVAVIDTPEEWLRSLSSAGLDLTAETEQSELSDVNDRAIAQALQGQRADAAKALEEAAKRLEGIGIQRHAETIRFGHPGREIVRAAADHGRDVLVISSHGWSGMKRALLGSVAEYIIRHNRAVPVLIAYPGADES